MSGEGNVTCSGYRCLNQSPDPNVDKLRIGITALRRQYIAGIQYRISAVNATNSFGLAAT
jgi:hypothetical protein